MCPSTCQREKAAAVAEARLQVMMRARKQRQELFARMSERRAKEIHELKVIIVNNLYFLFRRDFKYCLSVLNLMFIKIVTIFLLSDGLRGVPRRKGDSLERKLL